MAWLLSSKQKSYKWLIELIELLCLLHVCTSTGILTRLRSNDEVISHLPQYPSSHSRKCYTPTCRSEAFSIYKRLGGYFKPCDNFFLYTCGGFFMKENGPSDMENLQEKISNIIFEELLSQEISENDTHSIKNAKILFESCKNRDEQDFYAKLKSILIVELDGWPLLGDHFYKDLKPKNQSRMKRQDDTADDDDDHVDEDVDEDVKNDTIIEKPANKSVVLNDKIVVNNNTINSDINDDDDDENSDEITSTARNYPSSEPKEPTKKNDTTARMAEHEKEIIYDKMIKFFKLGINPFFRVDVDVNPFNNSKFAIWIRKPVSIRFKSHQIIDANLKFFLRRLVIFLNSSCSIESIDEQVNGTIRLETAFNLLNKKTRHTPPITNMTIQELAERIPDFDWKLFIVDKVFNQTFNMSIDLNQTIVIHDIETLKRSIEMFRNEIKNNKRDVDNFFVWELVKSMIQYLPSIEGNKTAQKSATVENKTAAMCSRYVTVNLNFLVSKYFIEKEVDSDALKGAIQMTESIRLEFIEMVNETEWMNDVSKKRAIQKLNNMVFKIAYPDYILNDTLMNEIYKSFMFNKSDFLNNDLLIKRITNLISFEYLHHEVHRQSWKFGPSLANAAYYTLLNEIYIPFGIIQPPFYNKNTLMLFNYARLGSIVGHEIAHGFDSEGRKFDHSGNFHSDNSGLWDLRSINQYRNKTDCFIRHYSNYTISNLAQKLNGVQTLEENISDNLGFKAAYRAYKKWVQLNGEESSLPDLYLNHDQLYFIAYAQTLCEFDTFKFVLEQNHSPNEIRLYGVVSNMKEFSAAFNCSSGDFHNPHEQCSIW